MQKVQTFRKQ